ncbi:MAG: hypothetical protein WCY48_04035 [Candidatus Caldatribacteriota bacterium]
MKSEVKMRQSLVLSLGIFLSFSFVDKGPMPHERTATPKQSNAHSGRYLYLGEVPKFKGEELEIYISKRALTTRVKAYVNQERIDTYAESLYKRWQTIDTAFKDPRLSYHPLVDITKLGEGRNSNIQAWIEIASQYSEHELASVSSAIFQNKRNAKNYSSVEKDDYKDTISKTYFKYLFGVDLESVNGDENKIRELISVNNSRALFQKHLSHLFTKDESRTDYLGYLTFVYPIAATTKGPNDIPKQGVYDLKSAESIEARWWSDVWKDEFAGLPFLLIDWNGVAFHGPISNYADLDIWFLRRGYVSHGCHRMDASDVMEFRTLMPGNLKAAAKKIKVIVLNGEDIVDWDLDGQKEVIDVQYYNIPTRVNANSSVTREAIIAKYNKTIQQRTFFNENPYTVKSYNTLSHSMDNISEFYFDGKKLNFVEVHSNLPIKSFEYRKTRIIQYTEEGVKLRGYDDTAGKYPPNYFQKY